MLDIETLSSRDDAAILSVGFAGFTEEGLIKEDQLEIRITTQANVNAGRHIDPETLEWWLMQSDQARTALTREPRFSNVGGAMLPISFFLEEFEPATLIWAKPPQFDIRILQDVMGNRWPFSFRNERCFRTLAALGRSMSIPVPERKGVAHSALDDAIHQAQHAVDILKVINEDHL